VSFFELYDLLNNSKLKYTQLRLMDDLNEGLGNVLGQLANNPFYQFKMSQEKIIELHNTERGNRYVSCWSKEKDLIAMWLLYSKNCDYIRIKTNSSKLKDATDKFVKVNFFTNHIKSPQATLMTFSLAEVEEVQYINFINLEKMLKKYKNDVDKLYKKYDYRNKDDLRKIIYENSDLCPTVFKKSSFIKDTAYQHEHELRSTFKIALRNDLSYDDFLKLKEEDKKNGEFHYLYKILDEEVKSNPNVIHIPVDDSFVEEICFDPRMPDFQKDIYIQALDLKDDIRIVETDIFGSKTKNIDFSMDWITE